MRSEGLSVSRGLLVLIVLAGYSQLGFSEPPTTTPPPKPAHASGGAKPDEARPARPSSEIPLKPQYQEFATRLMEASGGAESKEAITALDGKTKYSLKIDGNVLKNLDNPFQFLAAYRIRLGECASTDKGAQLLGQLIDDFIAMLSNGMKDGAGKASGYQEKVILTYISQIQRVLEQKRDLFTKKNEEGKSLQDFEDFKEADSVFSVSLEEFGKLYGHEGKIRKDNFKEDAQRKDEATKEIVEKADTAIAELSDRAKKGEKSCKFTRSKPESSGPRRSARTALPEPPSDTPSETAPAPRERRSGPKAGASDRAAQEPGLNPEAPQPGEEDPGAGKDPKETHKGQSTRPPTSQLSDLLQHFAQNGGMESLKKAQEEAAKKAVDEKLAPLLKGQEDAAKQLAAIEERRQMMAQEGDKAEQGNNQALQELIRSTMAKNDDKGQHGGGGGGSPMSPGSMLPALGQMLQPQQNPNQQNQQDDGRLAALEQQLAQQQQQQMQPPMQPQMPQQAPPQPPPQMATNSGDSRPMIDNLPAQPPIVLQDPNSSGYAELAKLQAQLLTAMQTRNAQNGLGQGMQGYGNNGMGMGMGGNSNLAALRGGGFGGFGARMANGVKTMANRLGTLGSRIGQMVQAPFRGNATGGAQGNVALNPQAGGRTVPARLQGGI